MRVAEWINVKLTEQVVIISKMIKVFCYPQEREALLRGLETVEQFFFFDVWTSSLMFGLRL